jgi:hypothetical protein
LGQRYPSRLVGGKAASSAWVVSAAFDAIYCCSPQLESLAQSLAALGLGADDVSDVCRLAHWVLNVAPLGPLPMSPSEAVALAERVHKVTAGE